MEVPVLFGEVVGVWVGLVRGTEVILVNEETPKNKWWVLYEVDHDLVHVYSFQSIASSRRPYFKSLYGEIDDVASVLNEELDLVLVKEIAIMIRVLLLMKH